MTSKAEYVRQYRRGHPEYVKRNLKLNAARHRALRQMARKYPEEFRRLYLAEIAKLRDAGEL